MTGMLSRYTSLFGHVTVLCYFILCLLADLCPLLRQHDGIFLVFIASITPSQWWCAWASQQQSVFWSLSSASKQRWKKKTFSFSVYIWCTVLVKSVNREWVPACHTVTFEFMCSLHPVGRDLIPRCALCLLHGHVHLWTRAGNRSSLSICKYNCVNQAITPLVCHIGLEFWGFSWFPGHSHIKYECKLTRQMFDMRSGFSPKVRTYLIPIPPSYTFRCWMLCTCFLRWS